MSRLYNVLINAIYRLHTMHHYVLIVSLHSLAFDILLHTVDSLLILNNLSAVLLQLAIDFTVV